MHARAQARQGQGLAILDGDPVDRVAVIVLDGDVVDAHLFASRPDFAHMTPVAEPGHDALARVIVCGEHVVGPLVHDPSLDDALRPVGLVHAQAGWAAKPGGEHLDAEQEAFADRCGVHAVFRPVAVGIPVAPEQGLAPFAFHAERPCGDRLVRRPLAEIRFQPVVERGRGAAEAHARTLVPGSEMQSGLVQPGSQIVLLVERVADEHAFHVGAPAARAFEHVQPSVAQPPADEVEERRAQADVPGPASGEVEIGDGQGGHGAAHVEPHAAGHVGGRNPAILHEHGRIGAFPIVPWAPIAVSGKEFVIGRAFDAGRALAFQHDRVPDMGAGVDDPFPVAQMGERQIADPHLFDGGEPAVGEHEAARREAGRAADDHVRVGQIPEVDSGDVAQVRAVVAVRMI